MNTANCRHPGERNGWSILTAEQVLEIRRRRTMGELLKVISADFKISIARASEICRGEGWKHLSQNAPHTVLQ